MKALVILCLLAGTAHADAIAGPPKCPKGHRPGSDHGGPYCVPPAPKCKKGEMPIQERQTWYCQPAPPKEGCPAGSVWASSSADDAFCNGTRRACESERPGCVETSLCVKEIERRVSGRVEYSWIEERVSGICPTDGSACPADTKCIPAKRYVAPPKAPAKPVKKGLLFFVLAASLGLGAAFRAVRRG